MSECKTIITDVEQLYEWCLEIDPRRQGKLLQEITLALKNTMREHKLEYLTAPQIGYNYRVFCIKFDKNDYRTFVNPQISENKGIGFERETCNSIPDKVFVMPRFGNIMLHYVTPLGKVESRRIVGRSATVVQHCIDHLNGLLINDIGMEIDSDFDNATEEEKTEIIKMYAESLDLRQKLIEEEIEKDKESKDLKNAIDFVASVKTGETQLDTNDTN